jgi:ankyrin repeat protein
MTDWYDKERLHFAAEEGDLQQVKALVESGYDINAFDESLSYTPLHYAVKSGNIMMVKYLLSMGAEVNAHEEKRIGETPLGAVASNCSYEMAEVLINAGANPTIPGWMQLTALDRARGRQTEEGRRIYSLLLNTVMWKFHYKV